MKILIVVFAVLSILLLLSTLICGLWIRNQPVPVDKSSLDFHLWIALGSISMTLLTLILAVVRVLQSAV